MSNQKFKQEFFEKVKNKFGNTYDLSLVDYKNNRTPVTIICSIHGQFDIRPETFLKSPKGCPKCSKQKNIPKETLIENLNTLLQRFDGTIFIDLDKTIFRTGLTSSDLWFKCSNKDHPSFCTSYDSIRISKYGCPLCGNSIQTQKRSMSYEEFLSKAKEIHGDKYIYSPDSFKNSSSVVSILCPTHGTFLCTPSRHINRKDGCRKCFLLSQRDTLDSFINKAKTVHGDKYDYSCVEYVDSKTKVSIKCLKEGHGLFFCKPGDHLNNKTGCPKCAKAFSQSKAEFLLVKFFKDLGFNVIHGHVIGKYELDVYIPELNLGIEYNGIIYHHYECLTSSVYEGRGKPKNYHKDKYNFFKQNGINLIHIFEFENLKEWMEILTLYVKNPFYYNIFYTNNKRIYQKGKLIFTYYGKSYIKPVLQASELNKNFSN